MKQQHLHNNVGSSQDKTKLTSSVLKGKLGFPNQVKTFGRERSKGCLVYLSALPVWSMHIHPMVHAKCTKQEW
jgi:hypothetical protein